MDMVVLHTREPEEEDTQRGVQLGAHTRVPDRHLHRVRLARAVRCTLRVVRRVIIRIIRRSLIIRLTRMLHMDLRIPHTRLTLPIRMDLRIPTGRTARIVPDTRADRLPRARSRL